MDTANTQEEEKEKGQEALTPDHVLHLYEDEDGEPAGFTLAESGDWIEEHKYAYRTSVLCHDATGRFFAIDENRSGSYWTDYEYGESACYEVVPQQVTVTKYVPLAEGS